MPHKYYKVLNTNVTEDMGEPVGGSNTYTLFYSDQVLEFNSLDEISKEEANTFLRDSYTELGEGA